MQAYGSCHSAIPDTQGVPIPTKPYERPGSDITSRMESVRRFTSPIVIANPDPFTGKQLTRPSPSKRTRGPAPSYDRDGMVKMWEEGHAVPAIAARFGCNRRSVFRALDAAGITSDKRPKSRKARTVGPQVLELYASGLNMKNVAQELHLQERTVKNILIDAGVTIRRTTSRLTPQDVEDRVLALRAEGNTYAQIIEATGLSETTVGRICRQRRDTYA